MIFESLDNLQRYKGLNKEINRILEIFKKSNASSFTVGRKDIDGDLLYMNFAEYETKSTENAKFEAHRKYIDVMYMIEGSETIYVKNVKKLKRITDEYNPETDALLADFEENSTKVLMQEGDVAIFFPQDAHAPGCIADHRQKVKKIIGKVYLNNAGE